MDFKQKKNVQIFEFRLEYFLVLDTWLNIQFSYHAIFKLMEKKSAVQLSGEAFPVNLMIICNRNSDEDISTSKKIKKLRSGLCSTTPNMGLRRREPKSRTYIRNKQ